MGLILLQVKELLRGDYYNQLENVKMHFFMKKEVIMKHWNGINTISNPFKALSWMFVVKGVGICLKFSNSKLIRGGHLFLRYKLDFFFKLLYDVWGTIYQMGIGEIQKKAN